MVVRTLLGPGSASALKEATWGGAVLDDLWAYPRWRRDGGRLEPIGVTDHVRILPRGTATH